MIPPKDSQITAASTIFGAVEQQKWLPILVGSRTYRLAASNFHDIASRLAAVPTGGLPAQQMNAAYSLINRVGNVDASINNPQDGKFSIHENREGYIEYAFAIIYGEDFIPRFDLSLGSSSVKNQAIW